MNSALGLAPLTNSLLNLLPRSAYEPEAYAASANSSTIGASSLVMFSTIFERLYLYVLSATFAV
jgi:hypothetical protein